MEKETRAAYDAQVNSIRIAISGGPDKVEAINQMINRQENKKELDDPVPYFNFDPTYRKDVIINLKMPHNRGLAKSALPVEISKNMGGEALDNMKSPREFTMKMS